jgi:arginine N-succinyltransferase
MNVIRPISMDDLEPLYDMATRAGHGLTSLPKDRELLAARIGESIESFARIGQKPRGETYLFVLEDLKTGRAVGTTGIVSKVGGFEPFYAYKVETAVAESDVLKVRKEIRFLKLVAEHNGPSEIGCLFLSPEHRKDNNGRLLSLSRFLFMAEFPKRFDPVVIAELRGVVNDEGHSPFWESLGRHFFDIDYPNADSLSGVNKKFIADLMPTHPIYIPLLPRSGQEVIGVVHEQSRPAMTLLLEEGFKPNGMVDIFDAGPVVQCKREEIRAVRESHKAAIEEIVEELPGAEPMLVSSARREFRVCKGVLERLPSGGVRLASRTALALNAKVGEGVRYVRMRATPATSPLPSAS